MLQGTLKTLSIGDRIRLEGYVTAREPGKLQTRQGEITKVSKSGGSVCIFCELRKSERWFTLAYATGGVFVLIGDDEWQYNPE